MKTRPKLLLGYLPLDIMHLNSVILHNLSALFPPHLSIIFTNIFCCFGSPILAPRSKSGWSKGIFDNGSFTLATFVSETVSNMRPSPWAMWQYLPWGQNFSRVRPFYEWAMSKLDRYMHRYLWVEVAHSSFIEGSHTTKNTAFGHLWRCKVFALATLGSSTRNRNNPICVASSKVAKASIWWLSLLPVLLFTNVSMA